MDTETLTKKLAVGDTITTADEFASLPVGSVVRGHAVAERRQEQHQILWYWADCGVEEYDFDAGAATSLGESKILWIEPEKQSEPRWLSRDPRHIREDLREALTAAVTAVHGEKVTNQHWVMVALIVGRLDLDGIEATLLATLSQFGVAVFGALLLHNLETKNSLMNQSEVMSRPRRLKELGLTVADLGWPNEVLRPEYQTP